MKDLVLIGAGGTASDILSMIPQIDSINRNYKIIGILDDNDELLGKQFNGVKVIGRLELSRSMPNNFFIDTLGSPKNPAIRETVTKDLGVPIERFVSVLHSTAHVASNSHLGFGVTLYPNVVIMSNATLGNKTTVLANSVINHDVVVNPYSTISSGVHVAGRVSVGDSTYIGAGSVIREDITVGKGSLIGMGSVVVDDVAPYSVVAGNPAKLIATA